MTLWERKVGSLSLDVPKWKVGHSSGLGFELCLSGMPAALCWVIYAGAPGSLCSVQCRPFLFCCLLLPENGCGGL